MDKKEFSGKGFVSLLTFGSFLVMAVTGLVLYFVPHGRVAYWVDWKLLGLTKTDWDNIHIISSLIFTVTGGFHLYYNWKIFLNYLTRKITSGLQYKKEMAIASVMTIALTIGAIYQAPPFNYVIDFSGYLKNTWIKSKDHEPPFGHAEEVSLKILTRKTSIELAKAVAELNKRGIIFDSVETKVKEIARANHISPMDLFGMINKLKISTPTTGKKYTAEMIDEQFSGTGIGNKRLAWMCEELGIKLETANQRLQKNNINMDADETLKRAANRLDIAPIDILKVILIENYSISN